MIKEKIEILGVHLLEESPEMVATFQKKASRYGIDLGWHYPLDLVWIARHLGDPNGKRILDAGAGTGVLQWWLADQGAQVVSVDRASRRDLSMRFRMAYRTRGLQPSDYEDERTLARRRFKDPSAGITDRLSAAIRATLASLLIPLWPKAPGEVFLYHGDLGTLAAIPDASIDHIVSVSALEHNNPDHLGEVVAELLRVLKPGGLLLATLGAALDDDWLHQPSQGWCYTESTLRKHFQCSENCPSNYQHYDELLAALRDNQQLQESLSPVYLKSGENGMPWGVWDPQYQPVGVLKRKEGSSGD